MLLDLDPSTVAALLGLADADIERATQGKFRDTIVIARDRLEAAVAKRFRDIETQLRAQGSITADGRAA